MNVDHLVREALMLPARDRALLATLLWESMEGPCPLALELNEDETLALAERRDGEIDSGMVAPLSHSDLMDRLRG